MPLLSLLPSLFVRFALICSAVILTAGSADAEQLRVMSAGGMAATHFALVPQFERATGHTVVTDAVSNGIGPASISNRVRRGDSVDVVILARDILDELISEGRVVASSRVDLAQSSIGMAVRKGAPKPDISSLDALKRTLLQAKSIAYSPQVSGIYLTTDVFPRLGIAEQMMKKGTRVDVGRVGTVVARGDAELGFQQISEILEIPEVDLVGPLPPGAQKVTLFSAGVVTGSKNPEAAQAFVELLRSKSGVAVMVKNGLEPVSRP